MEVELASLAQLERCHRRHDDVMAGLLEAARRFAAGRPEDTDLELVRDAVAYFERSVTRHFKDEEGSVFPRLSTRRPELAPELAALSAEHPTQVELQARVAAAVSNLDSGTRPSAGKDLLDAAMALAEAHNVHVGREDALFQIAQEALTPEDDAEISAEMETRRDRDPAGVRDDEGGGRRHGGGGGGGRGSGGGGGRGGGGGGGGGRGRRDERQMGILPVGDPIEVTDSEVGAGGISGPSDPTLDLKPVEKSAKRASAKPKAKEEAKTAKKPVKKSAAKKPAVKKPAAKSAHKAPSPRKPSAKKPSAKKTAKKTTKKATKKR